MSNKINDLGPKTVEVSGTRRSDSPRPGDSNTGDTRQLSHADKVSLTDSAVRLQKLEDTLAELPASDAQRIQALKQALANDTYQVDARRIADEIIKLERELS